MFDLVNEAYADLYGYVALSDEQVDKLISGGRELLRKNPDFQRFLAAHGGKAVVN